MKKRRFFILVPAVLILSFALVFFGYLRPEYDILLYVDNIAGEGFLQTSTSASTPFAHYYSAIAYFGSELKTLAIRGIHYDVDYLYLNISGVTAAEFDSYDVLFHGINLGHYEIEGKIEPGEYGGMYASVTEDGNRVRFDYKDVDEGTVTALYTHFAPVWFWVVYFGLILVVSLVLSLLFGIILNRFPLIQPILTGMAGIMVALLAGCFFCDSLAFVNYTDFLLNWLLLYALSLLIGAVTLPWLGTVLTMAFTTFWYVADYYVIIFRNKPIMPADLKAIGTAAEVMGSYSYTPSWQLIVGVLAVLAFGVVVVVSRRNNDGRRKHLSIRAKLMRRAAMALVAVLLMVYGVNTPAFKSLNSFAWDAALLHSFHSEGIVLTYLKCAFNSVVKRPEGYSQEKVQAYLEEYKAEQPDKQGKIRPTNIIMVMNEAFSDLRTVGLDDKINVMPFIDSLDENVIEGNLYVSVYGGGTCNTEFEALTGNSLAFLGIGAYPYTEYVTKPMFSLASFFGEQGYLVEAFHANEPQNWNRNMAYPNLGFSAFHSIKDYMGFGELPMLHELPADIADYNYIRDVDAKNSDRPRFLFNVTMQNHSGYERWEDVEKNETVEAYGSELCQDAQVYLSLISASDEAIQQLLESYRESDEPTMIIFFGDHQPGLPAYSHGQIYTDADSYLDWYKTKFFIWTNYESESAKDVSVSANYLPYLIMKQGNFDMPPYVRMLGELHEKYPVISAMGVIDAEGDVFGGVNDLPEDPLIQKYRYIQYANIFDEIDEAWFKLR